METHLFEKSLDPSLLSGGVVIPAKADIVESPISTGPTIG